LSALDLFALSIGPLRGASHRLPDFRVVAASFADHRPSAKINRASFLSALARRRLTSQR
jgi:hypothetical protein